MSDNQLDIDNKLAIAGGNKIKKTPFGQGKRFGFEEVNELVDALDQNTLFYHSGQKVNSFLKSFNDLYGVDYSVATSSGTASIHVALGAAGVSVGDEVITSPITDQGTLIGILYQNAIPVFADLKPNTYNMDPVSIESRISPRTKAILVVHLAGNPCDMQAIMDIAHKYQLKVVEDCAQSYLARFRGQLVGTIGDYGCFSTNDFKHISTGDGGIVTVNTGKKEDFLRTHAFADKNYQRFHDRVDRNLGYLAPNYRMTELQGAVGIAQLKKLPWICKQRNKMGNRITEGIKDLDSIHPHKVSDEDFCTYWFYMFRLDESRLICSREEFSEALKAEGIPNQPGYIPEVVYLQPMFQNQQAYLDSSFPFNLGDVTYKKGICPNSEEILQSAILIGINEFHTERDIEDIIRGIRKVARFFSKSDATKKRT